VGVPASMAWFPFTDERSFFGDLHIQGKEEYSSTPSKNDHDSLVRTQRRSEVSDPSGNPNLRLRPAERHN